MNVLILNWRDIKHPLAGGAEESLLKHAQYWRKQNVEITWFSSKFPNCKSEEIIDGIRYIRKGNHYTVHLQAFLYFMFHRVKQYNVIIDCFHFVPYFSPLYPLKAKRIALINEPAKNAWFKNITFPLSIIGFLLEPIFFIPYRNIQFITSAPSIYKELIMNYPIKQSNIHVIPHGVTVEKFKTKFKKEKKPTVLYASRITSDKGIEDAIKAISIVSQHIDNLKFWIIGKAEEEVYLKKIKQLSVDLDIKPFTNFFGFVNQKKKYQLMQKAWVLIHPSVREGWGLNVIEANFYETPVIGYNVTGLRDSIRDKKTGLLTKKNTPQELAITIETFIEDQKLRTTLGTNAGVYAKKFTWDEAGKKSWALIKKVTKS